MVTLNTLKAAKLEADITTGGVVNIHQGNINYGDLEATTGGVINAVDGRGAYSNSDYRTSGGALPPAVQSITDSSRKIKTEAAQRLHIRCTALSVFRQLKGWLFAAIRNVISRFSGKWSMLVLCVLSENEATRFNAIGKAIPDISPKVLTDTLRNLENLRYRKDSGLLLQS